MALHQTQMTVRILILKTNSPGDGGPNNGLGDTNIYHKQDTLSGDSGLKK